MRHLWPAEPCSIPRGATPGMFVAMVLFAGFRLQGPVPFCARRAVRVGVGADVRSHGQTVLLDTGDSGDAPRFWLDRKSVV